MKEHSEWSRRRLILLDLGLCCKCGKTQVKTPEIECQSCRAKRAECMRRLRKSHRNQA